MALDLAKTKEVFDKLFHDVNGRALSLKGREQEEFKSKSFVYGEVLPDSFYDIIQEVYAPGVPGQVFYDLGSGTGKAVLLAHLLFDFEKSKGIELVDQLYDASAEVKKRYDSEVKHTLGDAVKGRDIQMTLGSFLDADLTDADVIFMNSTCFQDDLMELLEEKLETVRPHCHIISLSKSFKSPSFHQYKHKMQEFSWGQATVFYHRKRLWKLYF